MEFMTMPAIDLSKPSDKQTQFSIFLGITIWFLHLNIVNALISVSCKWGGLTAPVGGLAVLQILSAVISVISLLLLGFFIYLPWRHWRSFQTEQPPSNPEMLQDTEKYRRSLMAFVAMS